MAALTVACGGSVDAKQSSAGDPDASSGGASGGRAPTSAVLDSGFSAGGTPTETGAQAEAGSAKQPYPGAEIACGVDLICQQGEVCCVGEPEDVVKAPPQGTTAVGCQLPQATCERGVVFRETFILICDGPEDCASGQSCCGDVGAHVWTGLVFYNVVGSRMIQEFRGADCVSSCTQRHLCHFDADCAPDERCVSPTRLAEIEYQTSTDPNPRLYGPPPEYAPMPYRVCAGASLLVVDAGGEGMDAGVSD